MDTFTLTCPTCGARLKITNDVDRFVCLYCGNEHIVKRDGGIVTLKPVVEGLQKIGISMDKTASELAMKRLKEEIFELQKQFEDANTARKRSTYSLLSFISTIFVGIYIISLQFPIVGILIVAVGSILTFFALRSNANWKRTCDKIWVVTEKKEDLLDKHRQIVDE